MSRKSRRGLNIEDLSLVLRQAGQDDRPREQEPLPEDLSLPILVDSRAEGKLDDTVLIIDSMTSARQQVYSFPRGRYLRCRLAVLGIGEEVERVHRLVHGLLGDAVDPLLRDINVWVRYQVALFGGRPRGPVTRRDAELVADRLTLYKPNFLVLVNAGQVKDRFAFKTPQQLAMLTHHINRGALAGGQRPYRLILVTDRDIPEKRFAEYQRICRTTLNTFPAERQFSTSEIGSLVAYAKEALRAHTERYFTVRSV